MNPSLLLLTALPERDAIANDLQHGGYKVVLAATREEALQKAESCQLIILDEGIAPAPDVWKLAQLFIDSSNGSPRGILILLNSHQHADSTLFQHPLLDTITMPFSTDELLTHLDGLRAKLHAGDTLLKR